MSGVTLNLDGTYTSIKRPNWRIIKYNRYLWNAYNTKNPTQTFAARTLSDVLNALGG